MNNIYLEFAGTGDDELDEVFEHAEKWSRLDYDYDESARPDFKQHKDEIKATVEFQGVAVWHLFVRHPRYLGCTAHVTVPVNSWKLVLGVDVYSGHAVPEELRLRAFGEPKRVIEDDADTSLKALRQIAKYTSHLARKQVIQIQRGGAKATPEKKRWKIVKGWVERQGLERQVDYCGRKGVDERTLRDWISKFIKQGKLERDKKRILVILDD